MVYLAWFSKYPDQIPSPPALSPFRACLKTRFGVETFQMECARPRTQQRALREASEKQGAIAC